MQVCYHAALHYGNVENGRSADGKQIFTARWKAVSFPTDRKHRFPQLRPLTVYTHSHSAYYCGYYMILVYRKGKENKKAGASPSVQTEGGAPNSIS